MSKPSDFYDTKSAVWVPTESERKLYDAIIVSPSHQTKVVFKRTIVDRLLRRKGNTGDIAGFVKVKR